MATIHQEDISPEVFRPKLCVQFSFHPNMIHIPGIISFFT